MERKLPQNPNKRTQKRTAEAVLFLFLGKVYVQLRIGNGDPLPIESGLDPFLHGVIDGPIVLLFTPEFRHHCDGAILQFSYGDQRLRVTENTGLSVYQFFQDFLCLYQIRLVGDPIRFTVPSYVPMER